VSGAPAVTASTSRVAGVDGLRACAALAVLGYHVALACSLTRVGPLAPLFAELKAGVAMFFVISGFVLYRPYARAITGSRPLPSWRAFLNHRALRILPAYWVALTVLAFGPLRLSLISANGWRYFMLGQIYNSDTVLGGLGVAWSLCVEVSFYAALPLFAWGVSRSTRGRGSRAAARLQLVALGGIAAAGVLLRLILTRSLIGQVPSGGTTTLEIALPGFLDWFAAGMALAVLAGTWESGERLPPRVAALARRPAWCRGLGAACFGLSALTQPQDLFLPLYGVTAHLVTGLGCVLIVLPTVLGVGKALQHRVMTWLGTVSYGIYLWQVPVLQAIDGQGPPGTSTAPVEALGLFVVVAAIAVGLGAASWYLVEQPSSRLLWPRPGTGLAEAAAAKTV
jgi:peptidoglycan/LPS O-acetylase OafA/YrhL